MRSLHDALVRAGDRAYHGGQIDGLGLDRQRVGGERILLHIVYVMLDAVGKREDQRDADDADRAGKGGEEGAGLLRHEIVEREAQRGLEAHGRLGERTSRLRRRCRFRAGRGVADDLAVEQAYGARGIALGQLRVVRDHDDEFVVGNLLQKIHNLHACLGVERAGRFVRQQNIRVVHKRTRNGHALHLSAGHLVRYLIELIAESDTLQHLDRTLAALCRGHAGERERQLHIGKHRLVRDQVVALEYETDGVVAVGVPVTVGELLGGFSVDDQVTGGVAIQAADDVQQRGLAAAGLSQNGDEFAFPEGDADAFQRPNRGAAGLIVLHNVFQFQHVRLLLN